MSEAILDNQIGELQPVGTFDVPRDNRGRIRWVALRDDPLKIAAVIELQAARCLANDIRLTYAGLREHGASDLEHAINRYYPGRFTALREKLGSPIKYAVVRQIKIERQENGLSSNQRGQICWTIPGATDEENLALGIQNIQALFLEKFPEFNALFPRNENDEVAESKREQARNFILDKLGSRQKFQKNISHSPFNQQFYPYFEGSYYVATRRSFTPWGIEFEQWCQLDKETGIYADGERNSWVPIHYFRKKYGVAPETVQSLSPNPHTLIGRTNSGKQIILYSQEEVSPVIEEMIAQQANIETGIYTDEDLERWAPFNYFTVKYGLGNRTLIPFLQKIRSIKGRTRSRASTTLYNVSEIEVDSKLQDLISCPKVDKETEIYTDDDGINWIVPYSYFKKRFGINIGNAKRYFDSASHIPGRDNKGRPVKLFPEEEIIAILEERRFIGPNRHEFNRWTIKAIEERALEFYQAEKELSYPLLKQLGQSPLAHIINGKYPGGLTALREKLGIEDQNSNISPDEANKQLTKLIEDSV